MKSKMNRLVVAMVVLSLASVLATGCGGSSQTTSEASTQTTQSAADPEAMNMGQLLADLVSAYETPSDQANQAVTTDLQAIQAASPSDYEIAQSIADHWNRVYVDPSYVIYTYGGGELAPELLGSGIPEGSGHAFVVLGYELKNGEMQDELKGRCQAAAAAARSYPESILVCSGGATGKNNPEGHTEAGLMKAYLVNECGIDESRIFIDEKAMTTAENALNTMEMLRAQNIQTMTIVTSTYHQQWGQAVYNAVAALYRQNNGYNVDMVANYCYQIEPSVPAYRQGDRIAAQQIAGILGLPQEAIALLPEISK